MKVVARAELTKLSAQLPLQVLAVLVIAGPVAFAALLSSQSGTPADALMGAYAHASGFSLPLVLLSFAGNWGAPIIAGIVGGDLFASEDRHRTWKTILGRGVTLSELFAGKLAAAAVVSLILGVVMAVAALAAGMIFVGTQPMVDLSGRLLSGGHLLVLELIGWLLTLPALLAFTAIAALVSIATRNAIMGVLAPLVVGLLDQLLALTGNGTWMHLLLISSAFDAWQGIMTAHVFLGPALVSELACLLWSAGAIWAGWRLLSRREFVPAESGGERRRGRALLLAPARVVAVGVVVVAVLVGLTTLGPAGVTNARVTAALTDSFQRLTLYQQALESHPIPAGSHYTIRPLCNKRGATPVGQGDWDCTVNVYVLLPSGAQPLTDTPVDYDVNVASDGCFKAAAPAVIVGGQTITGPHGTRVLNPLNIIYSCFNTL